MIFKTKIWTHVIIKTWTIILSFAFHTSKIIFNKFPIYTKLVLLTNYKYRIYLHVLMIKSYKTIVEIFSLTKNSYRLTSPILFL
jgi:hypothetical protein